MPPRKKRSVNTKAQNRGATSDHSLTTAGHQRTLLLLENEYELTTELDRLLAANGAWRVVLARSSTQLLESLNAMTMERRLPHVVSIDLGIDDMPHSLTRGLELLREIRKKWQGLALSVHTQQDLDEPAVRTIALHGASLFWLRDQDQFETYAQLLPFMAIGCVVFSAKAAPMLAKVIARFPDPFFFSGSVYWETMAMLDRGRTYAEIGKAGIGRAGSERGIANRVKTIADILIDLGEIDAFEEGLKPKADDYRKMVVEWYRANKNRFDPKRRIKT